MYVYNLKHVFNAVKIKIQARLKSRCYWNMTATRVIGTRSFEVK